jgi:hypothetical protein
MFLQFGNFSQLVTQLTSLERKDVNIEGVFLIWQLSNFSALHACHPQLRTILNGKISFALAAQTICQLLGLALWTITS